MKTLIRHEILVGQVLLHPCACHCQRKRCKDVRVSAAKLNLVLDGGNKTTRGKELLVAASTGIRKSYYDVQILKIIFPILQA